MATVNLTKRVVDALRPRAARFDVYDRAVAGFVCRVSPDGRKSFSLLYRAGSGRSAPKRRLTIGEYGALTVDQARQRAAEARAQIQLGGDPAVDRAAAKGAPTIATLGVDFMADVDARRKPKTASEYRRQWNKHIVPSLGSKRVADATTADVAKLHRSLRGNGPYLANRVLALLGSFFTYAERQGIRPRHSNPAAEVDPFRESTRERFLTPEEIGRLGDALRRAETTGLPLAAIHRRSRRSRTTESETAIAQPSDARSDSKTAAANLYAVAALRLLLISGWRKSEVLTLRWDAIDADRGIATLSDTKTGRSQRQLGAPALALLGELPRVEGSPYVFPGGRKLDCPRVDLARLWCSVRLAAGLEDVRLHDLRHSFASISASAGAALLIIGKLLGHHETASTARYAHLLDAPVKAAADAAAKEIAIQLANGRDTATPALRLAK
ncbi:MAG TPA: tyrosine-type recombinase/integrase [Gemmatimonadaceae bacterium]|nr:tyrosine-type recombinase/integrase [Gemmatimonadaceae bacterium]